MKKGIFPSPLNISNSTRSSSIITAAPTMYRNLFFNEIVTILSVKKIPGYTELDISSQVGVIGDQIIFKV